MAGSTSIPAEFETLVNEAIEVWSPNSRITILKDLVGGRSSALVFLIDISPSESTPGSAGRRLGQISGEFILKLDEERVWDEPEPVESERHEAAEAWNTDFSSSHIPRLVNHHRRNQQLALLYEIAGLSLVGVVTADNLDSGALQQRTGQVAQELLEVWNSNYETSQAVLRDLLTNWLGYRLDSSKAPKLHEFVEEETGTSATYIAAGKVFVNPLWLCNAPFWTDTAPHNYFSGVIHGDLHPGNLLVERQDPRSQKYWIIDFALSRNGPLFYDHAYLEIALALHHLEGVDTERMIGILDAVEATAGTAESTMVPVADLGLVKCIRSIRIAADNWQQKMESHRHDSYLGQYSLARVAAALNWCNKPLPRSARRLALSYGAWYARHYVTIFQSDTWKGLASGIEPTASEILPSSNSETNVEKEESWTDVWETAERFDASTRTYLLVSGRHPESKTDLASLGLLPWSAVIDFDPKSDENGLHSHASPLLKRIRAFTQYGLTSLQVDYARGTSWVMANGWPSRHEPIPESLREWRRNYLPVIRKLCRDIHRSVAPQHVTVVVLPGEGLAKDRLSRTLEAIDEGLGDLSEVLLFGAEDYDDAVVLRAFSVSPQMFISGVRAMYGTSDEIQDPEIPGADGPVSIPLDQIRSLEEDLDILHSRVLVESKQDLHNGDEFWRGMPPTWTDLHAGVDIAREVSPALVRKLDESLKQNRNLTIELHHSPGAGGTTVSLRAAWALRTTHPTVVLRRASRLTVDRIDQLFQLAQRPILLIADASILSPTAREEMYRDFSSRNTRVVILYVIRTIALDHERSFAVPDPMKKAEAVKFADAYSQRTTSSRTKGQLRKIATSNEDQWKRYRSPFFFGLFTYEREFDGLERFVETHIAGLGYRPRQAFLHLALVTRYSQVCLDLGVVHSLLGIRSATRVELNEVLGSAPSRLILRRKRQCKLLHPLIAEEVLRKLLGGQEGDSWKDGLKDLALDFIQDIVKIHGKDADAANRLFVQLFIQRDVWYEKQARGRPRFSELISDIPTAAGQHQVLQLLTELCPDEAHYWNHLGRHHYYEMRQDFAQAEVYLQKAVELSPNDSYHHHSLGMARRIWIEEKLAEMFQSSEPPSPEVLLSEVSSLSTAAIDNFETARGLNPDDEHGYVTQVQMILHITERLARAAGSGGLLAAVRSRGAVSEWIEDNLGVAGELLTSLGHLRAQSPPSRYELSCKAQLSGIYGDYDDVIGQWERLLEANDVNQANLRRVLANAYHARGGHTWSSLPDEELRRIASLMETNLREDPTNHRDVRNWFQAYRRLPEFSYLESIDRLEAWATRSDSVDAYYYLYIIHFLRYLDGTTRKENIVVEAIEECKCRAHGRRHHSYEWLGNVPKWCPLVHHRDLGEWNRELNFYSDTVALRTVTGSIETIRGHKAGTIRLGKKIRAFFVPGTRQWESKDVNAIVNFRLGFSYEGLRAWSVRLIDDAKDPQTVIIENLVKEAANGNHEVPVVTIGNWLIRDFPGRTIPHEYGFSNLTKYLRSIPGVRIIGYRGAPAVSYDSERDKP